MSALHALSGPPKPTQSPLLSVVIPLYNEIQVVEHCHRRLLKVLEGMCCDAQVIYIDDGSTDGTWTRLQQLLAETQTQQAHIQTVCLQLSRNFGKEAAMCAGLQRVTGQAVVILDADLQDPPELIPEMLALWQQGYHVVEMQRTRRHGESWWKRSTASGFYWLLSHLSEIEIAKNTGDFRLIDRRVVEDINRMPERTRFMKGLFAWPGYQRTRLHYERPARSAGESKWPFSKLLHLALEGITSFSMKPLRLASVLGVAVSSLALISMLAVLLKTVFWGDPVAGYPTLMTVILFLGGVQLLALGLLGEYIGRLFIEAKQRPLYLVMEEAQYNHRKQEQRASSS